MFIPIGLIARPVFDARDAQTEDEMRRAGIEHDRDAQDALEHELWSACAGPSGCLLIDQALTTRVKVLLGRA